MRHNLIFKTKLIMSFSWKSRLKPLYESPNRNSIYSQQSHYQDWSTNVERVLYPPKVRRWVIFSRQTWEKQNFVENTNFISNKNHSNTKDDDDKISHSIHVTINFIHKPKSTFPLEIHSYKKPLTTT